MCQEHTGCHNENTDVCPVLIKRLAYKTDKNVVKLQVNRLFLKA